MLRPYKVKLGRLYRRYTPFSISEKAQLLRVIERQETVIGDLLEGLLEIKAEWNDPLSQLANQASKKVNKQ